MLIAARKVPTFTTIIEKIARDRETPRVRNIYVVVEGVQSAVTSYVTCIERPLQWFSPNRHA